VLGGVLGRGGASQAAGPETPNAYSVAFEATLAERGIGTRLSHFVDANTQLLKATGDPLLGPALREALGANFEGTILDRSGSGRVLGSSPEGWTWHHVVDRPGVLQLVPRSQHAPGSIWQDLLHPGGVGGFSLWGSEF
jgi:hypothetical protein